MMVIVLQSSLSLWLLSSCMNGWYTQKLIFTCTAFFFSKTKFIPLTALVIFVIIFIQASNLRAEDITALGISTMRGTFLTWDRYM